MQAEPQPQPTAPDEAVFLNGAWRVYFRGQMLKHEWFIRGAAEAALDLLQKGAGVITDEGLIKWNPEVHLPLLTLEARKRTVYEVSNLLQSVMGYLELGNEQRARAALEDALEMMQNLRDGFTNGESTNVATRTKKNPASAG